MKKIVYVFAILATMMLGACSILDEVNNSLDYVNEAKNYIHSLSEFAEQAPQLFKDAGVDSDARVELENQLNVLVDKVEEFNELNPPTIAKDIHQDIVSKNETLLVEINKVMENGEVALDKLENSEIVNSVNDITSLLDSIENLEL